MKPGETVESAIWLDGHETSEDLRRFKADVIDAIDTACAESNVKRSPVVFVEKKPGDERVPAVPDHIQGLDVRLLVAEADIVGYVKPETSRAFVGDLDAKDLETLRGITKRAHQAHNPGKTLTNIQCDDVIETLGPDTALKTLGAEVH